MLERHDRVGLLAFDAAAVNDAGPQDHDRVRPNSSSELAYPSGHKAEAVLLRWLKVELDSFALDEEAVAGSLDGGEVHPSILTWAAAKADGPPPPSAAQVSQDFSLRPMRCGSRRGDALLAAMVGRPPDSVMGVRFLGYTAAPIGAPLLLVVILLIVIVILLIPSERRPLNASSCSRHPAGAGP